MNVSRSPVSEAMNTVREELERRMSQYIGRQDTPETRARIAADLDSYVSERERTAIADEESVEVVEVQATGYARSEESYQIPSVSVSVVDEHMEPVVESAAQADWYDRMRGVETVQVSGVIRIDEGSLAPHNHDVYRDGTSNDLTIAELVVPGGATLNARRVQMPTFSLSGVFDTIRPLDQPTGNTYDRQYTFGSTSNVGIGTNSRVQETTIGMGESIYTFKPNGDMTYNGEDDKEHTLNIPETIDRLAALEATVEAQKEMIERFLKHHNFQRGIRG